MNRREVVAGLALMPIARDAQAQTAERVRRIGVLMSVVAGDAEGEARLAAFIAGLQQLGWAEGRNVRVDVRWTGGGAEDAGRYAAELVKREPQVILVSGGSIVGPTLRAARHVPIVFTQTPDPVGAGFVASLTHPGGNATGFTHVEYAMGAKWLELLREVAPNTRRVAVVRDPAIPEGIGQLAVIQSAASSLGIDAKPINIDVGEIQQTLATFARTPNGGLIVTSSGLANVHRDLLITLAERHKLPAIFSTRFFTRNGGLISYGADSIDPHRRAASYVDRILKGERPADLPVQGPTKYELVINLKTAMALGLAIPPTLLARADEVIE